MKRKIITIIGIVAIVAAIIVVSSMNTSKKEKKRVEERTVVINYNPENYASAVFQIAKEKNLFDQYMPEGVTIEWTTISSASDIRDAIVSGEVDLGTPGIMAFMTAIDNDMPLTLLSFNGYATVKAYSNQDNIQSMKDFKDGDQISISGLASNPQAAFIAALKEEKLDVEKYNKMLTKVPNPEALALLETNKQIKGSILSFSANLDAEKMENVHLVRDFTDVIEKYSIGTALIANNDFYEKNKDICDAVMKVQEEVMKNWKKDLKENAKILSNQYECEIEDITDLMKKQPPTNKLTGYDKLAKLLYDAGMLSSPLKLKNLNNYENIPR